VRRYLDFMSIHQRIRERREALGLSQQRLAELVGVTYQAVQHWEREPVETDTDEEGKVHSTAPSRRRLALVAQALKCTPEWLMTGKMLVPGEVDPEEAMYLDMFRKLPQPVRDSLRAQLQATYNALNPDRPHPVDPFSGKKPPDE
jgi:transcriptional regulator with XRE-family HTH domain